MALPLGCMHTLLATFKRYLIGKLSERSDLWVRTNKNPSFAIYNAFQNDLGHVSKIPVCISPLVL